MKNNETTDLHPDGVVRKLTTVIFIFAIVLVAIWTGYLVGTRKPSRYLEFGILNAEGTAGPFPTQVSPGQQFNTSFELTNFLGEEATFEVRVSLASMYSEINFTTGADNVTLLEARKKTLAQGETWRSQPVILSLSSPGVNLSITYEVFRIIEQEFIFVPDNILYFRLNCTA